MIFFYNPSDNIILDDFVRVLLGQRKFFRILKTNCFVSLSKELITDFPIYYAFIRLIALFSKRKIVFLNLEVWGYDVKNGSVKRRVRNLIFRCIVKWSLQSSKTLIIVRPPPRKQFYESLVKRVAADIRVLENVA